MKIIYLIFFIIGAFVNVSQATLNNLIIEQKWLAEYNKGTNTFLNKNFWFREYKKDRVNVELEKLTQEEIQEFNQTLIEENKLYDLINLETFLESNTYKTLLNSNLLKNEIKYNNNLKYFTGLEKNLNLKKIKDSFLNYGVVIGTTNLRSLPTNTPYFSDPDDTHFDLLQETDLQIGQAVRIRHYTKDKKWAFVICDSYYGWMETKYLATTNKNDFINHLSVQDKEYIVVINKQVNIEDNIVNMGTKFELVQEKEREYIINFPIKNNKNELLFKQIIITKSDDFSKGFLTYNIKNIVEQTFKYLNHNYGWGNLKNGVDCSGFILNVYKTFGLNLPRNSSKQVNIGDNSILFNKNFSNDVKLKLLNRLEPGAIIYMKGHIMVYLGNYNNNYYIIHSLGSHTIDNEKIKVMKVVVTDLFLTNSKGNSFFNEIAGFMEIKQNENIRK